MSAKCLKADLRQSFRHFRVVAEGDIDHYVMGQGIAQNGLTVVARPKTIKERKTRQIFLLRPVQTVVAQIFKDN